MGWTRWKKPARKGVGYNRKRERATNLRSNPHRVWMVRRKKGLNG